MRKLRLEQPFASMVMCGSLQTIPDKWGDVKVGEKIFIYADKMSKEFFQSPFDYGSEIDRKYSNETFFGNLPDSEYKIKEYLGYVTVSAIGATTEGWPIGTDKSLFVARPFEFEQSIEDYNEDIVKLDKSRAHSINRNVMKRYGEELVVPVGPLGWDEVRDKENFKNTFVYWEAYMNEISPSPWTKLESKKIEEPILTVTFVYGKQKIIFESSVGIPETGWDERVYEKEGERYSVEVFDFNLCYLDPCSKVGFYDPSEDKERNNTRGSSRQWVKIIYTPMGGMTKWKRR